MRPYTPREEKNLTLQVFSTLRGKNPRSLYLPLYRKFKQLHLYICKNKYNDIKRKKKNLNRHMTN